MDQDYIYGRRPVAELLSSDRPVECLMIQKGTEGGAGKLIALAKARGVPVKTADVKRLDELSGGGRHQGAVALTGAQSYVELEDILGAGRDKPLLLVLADGIEDPHNLGALIRTAESAGAHGLILPSRRSAGLSGVVAKASAGAIMHLPAARVAGLPETIEKLKKAGIWVYGADMAGEPYDQTDFSGPVALVMGGEGKGLGRLVKERCDRLVSIPMRGRTEALNVSVAAGIILYEIARQRDKAAGKDG
ncbi:MAG: 23S rRNA (guanosine(2251)-2'-O)-methyltransferase RlmB [Oscillospiraceae bacterium]|jgi:23S rRNA (guanosine2251-2'-O)-methyltransferase|nr:23S rRNA (guanosine(2251)-2'-O)-methyltransferase RlmB [Oscillospiraceae bacterium]